MTTFPRWIPPVALLLVLWLARHSLSPFVVGGMLAYILSPLVDSLTERTRWPRVATALLVAVVFIALVGSGIWLLGARLVTEARSLGGDVPSIVDSAVESLTGGSTLDVLGQRVSPEDLSARIQAGVGDAIGSPSDVVHAARVALEWSLKVFLVLLVFIYLLVDGQRLGVFLLRFVPSEHRPHAENVAGQIHRLLGRYLQGQLLLVAIVSIAVFVGLEWIFHLKYALPLAVATGFLEIIPFLGPIAAGAIAASVALAQQGPAAAGWVALFFLILRQVEDQLVMPVVVGRAVHVHPLATIFAVVVGERVAGVLGMLLAVPLTAAAKVVLDYAYPSANPDLEHSRTRRVSLTTGAASAGVSASDAQPVSDGQPVEPATIPASSATASPSPTLPTPTAPDPHHAG